MSNAQMYVDVFSLPGFLQALLRHRKKVLFTFLILVALTVLFVVSREREYASSAQLFVRIGRETVSVDPTAEAAGRLISVTDTQEREIRSIVSVLGNRDLLEQVVDDLGPTTILEESKEPSALKKVIKPIRESIKSTLVTSGILEGCAGGRSGRHLVGDQRFGNRRNSRVGPKDPCVADRPSPGRAP
jgi:uncharacterized protein involved in exopolysaccharide biosynthesis